MTALIQYERARAALADATKVEEILPLKAEVEHLKLYARQIQDRVLLAEAHAFQVRVERKLGLVIQAAKEAGQIAEGRPKKRPENCSASEQFPRVTLDEVGIDRKLSSRAQRLASISERAVEAVIEDMRARVAGGAAKVVLDPVAAAEAAARKERAKAEHAVRVLDGCDVGDLQALITQGRKFKSILIDPPWKFIARSEKGEGRSAGEHYTTTGLDPIKALPLTDLAADDCVMFMWMVDWCPKWALELIEHWGFEHKTTAFTWAKQTESGEGWHMGQGYWTRANPEDCWLATRGHPQRIHADVRQLVVAPVMEHSRKPDEIHDRIMRLVDGPYLEIYARRARNGWVTWGNEISREQFAAICDEPFDPKTGEIPERPKASDLAMPLPSAASCQATPSVPELASESCGSPQTPGAGSPSSTEDIDLEIPPFLRRKSEGADAR
jgi:N6-adenosine-specific RNA methylase IME4